MYTQIMQHIDLKGNDLVEVVNSAAHDGLPVLMKLLTKRAEKAQYHPGLK